MQVDYSLAVIFFALGLALAVLARGTWRWAGRDAKPGNLPVRNGAVRLDRLVGGSRSAEPEDGLGEETYGLEAEVQTADAGRAPSNGRVVRAGRRKRRMK